MPGEVVGWTPEQRAEFKALLGDVKRLNKRAGGSAPRKKKGKKKRVLKDAMLRKPKGYKEPKPTLMGPINRNQQRQLRRLEREQY